MAIDGGIMKKKDNLYESISTKTYRVVLMHNETDKSLIEQLEQRGYSHQDIDLINDWFLEIHNNDKTLHTDHYGTYMFLFSFRCGVRLRDLQTKDILENIERLIDKQDKDFYYSLLISERKELKKHGRK